MKRFFLLAVFALGLFIVPTARAQQNDNAQIKAKIVENYLLTEIAFRNRDAVRMISFESPDYTSVREDGRIFNKVESDAMWHKVMDSIEKVYNVRAEIKQLTIEPHRVVVRSTQSLDADIRWPIDTTQHVVITGKTRDIWVNYDGVWMLKRSEDLETKSVIR